jgi:ATP-dependent DNA helicase RecG
MAPTETLAEQHFQTLQRLMPGELVQAALLTGSTPRRAPHRPARQARDRELRLLVAPTR